MNEDTIALTAKERFNISGLFPYQRLVIHNILAGCGFYGKEIGDESFHRQTVILPTGSGKSLCFMLPGVLLSGTTLIVFPLLSLIADQGRRLQDAAVPFGILKGGQSKEERSALFSAARNNELSFILTNPEMLRQESIQRTLKEIDLSHIVIDEAHTLSQWGTTFRPSYLELGNAIKHIGEVQTTAFTATADKSALDDIRKYLFLDEEYHLIRGNPDRPNISYRAVPALAKEHELKQLTHPVTGMQRPLIVFVSSRKLTVSLAALLRLEHGDDEIRYYHAGLPKEERKHIETWFFNSDKGILVSTIAYGMGLDKGNIRSVIHYTISSSPEAYLQETGRAGRDRSHAESVLLLGGDSEKKIGRNRGSTFLESLEEQSRNEIEKFPDNRTARLLAVFTSADTCRREALLAMLEAEPEVCFGCDICSKSRISIAHGEKEILQLVTRNQLKFTSHQAALILRGKLSLEVRKSQLYYVREFGLLADWNIEEIQTAIEALHTVGLLKTGGKGLWKQKLRTPEYPATMIKQTFSKVFRRNLSRHPPSPGARPAAASPHRHSEAATDGRKEAESTHFPAIQEYRKNRWKSGELPSPGFSEELHREC